MRCEIMSYKSYSPGNYTKSDIYCHLVFYATDGNFMGDTSYE